MVKIQKVKYLLTQAMREMSGDNETTSAKHHVRQALIKLENIPKKVKAKTEAGKWWDTVVAGTAKFAESKTAKFADSNSSAVATQKTLSQLNAMIGEEQKKLDKLEIEADEELLSE